MNCDSENKARSNCLENAVYLELVSRGIKPRGKVIFGEKNNVDGEIDFNYKTDNKEFHIQVAHTINAHNYDREIGNLKMIVTSSSKKVIYMFDLIGVEEKDLQMLKADIFFSEGIENETIG